jgi:hypothetical protein
MAAFDVEIVGCMLTATLILDTTNNEQRCVTGGPSLPLEIQIQGRRPILTVDLEPSLTTNNVGNLTIHKFSLNLTTGVGTGGGLNGKCKFIATACYTDSSRRGPLDKIAGLQRTVNCVPAGTATAKSKAPGKAKGKTKPKRSRGSART